jgi:hypothetical protein
MGEVKLMVRTVSQYDFEDGRFVRIVATADLPTLEIIEAAETMLRLKREELERRALRSSEPDKEG